MDINYFKEFVTLADSGNYLEAAERLFISQSTLSKHIQKMETELGCKLFERTTRKIRLTTFGELLLPYAKQIVETQKQYIEVISKKLEVLQSKVTIGSIPTMGHYAITEVLAIFKKSNPSFELQVVEAESRVLINMLRNKECDFVFVREAINDKEDNRFMRVSFDEDILVAVLPTKHWLARRKEVSLWELRRESFILLPRETLVSKVCFSACKEAGFEPKVVLTCDRDENVMSLVEKGLGITLLMKKPATHLAQHREVAIVTIVPKIQTRICLYYGKRTHFSKAAKAFLKCVQEYQSTIQRNK